MEEVSLGKYAGHRVNEVIKARIQAGGDDWTVNLESSHLPTHACIWNLGMILGPAAGCASRTFLSRPIAIRLHCNVTLWSNQITLYSTMCDSCHEELPNEKARLLILALGLAMAALLMLTQRHMRYICPLGSGLTPYLAPV